MKNFTVLWEDENGEMYNHDFKARNMSHAMDVVMELAKHAKKHNPDSPECDMWDAGIEIQEV